ncbi:spindle assembly checkpoint component Mad1 [Sphaerosporella brunnea]|uniref:Spindle assembly checkpoint component MAD1 n=1 Tax=Sphaerosporella brunnea TaxID=1250544 RepID=A0A5J5FAC3_9PEZI|nr:spindle assembly checkpoint component Mad1 [Sphaerosporella brunnea]
MAACKHIRTHLDGFKPQEVASLNAGLESFSVIHVTKRGQSLGTDPILFPNNNNNAGNRLQPTYDFLTSEGPATPPPRAPSAPPISALRTAVVKIDQSNEIIRGDLNSVRALEKAAVEEQARRADALESDKRFLYEKQKELGDKLAQTKETTAAEKQDLERQEQVGEREEDLRRISEEAETKTKALIQTNQELEEEVGLKNRTIDDLRGKLEGVDAEVQDLQEALLRTLKVLQKQLSEQAKNRRQAAELKALRDEKRSLELGKLKVLDELREELSGAQVQISKEGLEFHSPESLARALVEERVEKAALLERAGRANPELHEKENVIQELEGEESSSKDAKARQRMERQKALALKEAQFLQALYNQGGFDEQKAQRIQELEGMLEAYKAEIEELKATVAAFQGTETAGSKKRPLEVNGNDERLGELMRRNRQLQDDIMHLQQKETVLNKEIEALQFRLTSMEGTSTRILQLKDNPTAREQAVKVSELKALKEENAALLAQLEGREGELRMVPRATLENVRAEVKAMEKLVAEKEKRMARLKEIWTAKSLEFREAVFSLLGYKIDFLPSGRVRVTHMFGNDSQSIEFDGDKGTMKVAGGPDSLFHKEIRNQCAFWMARQSIP